MQIQKVNIGVTSNNNTSFGYNPEVNAALIHKLEQQKQHKGFYRYIKNLVLTTNEAERDLRLAEKKKTKKGTELTLLAAAFIPLKVQITDLINRFFPNFDYRKKELESYQEEIQNRNLEEEQPAHWMNTLAEILREQDVQDRAEVATYVLQNFMKEQFPDLNFDFSGLTGIYKQKYMEEDGEYENYDNEPEDADSIPKDVNVNVNMNINGSKANNKDLAERIELGKSKVFHYEPKDENELKGFASLGGMKELKKQLTEDIIIPLKDPAKAKYNEKHYGIKMPNGILFYGPPGCGKTTIVERLSVETGLPLLELTTDSFGSEYMNGSEINLGAVFDYAASIASEEKPVILFIDDVDGIVGTRNAFMHDHKKSELSVFLKRVQDAPKNNIIVMAATNNYDGIDKAFTSRLRQQIYTGLPDKDARKSIIKLKLEETDNGQNLAKDEKALDRIAELTESFPIRALEDFATETRKMAFVNGIRDITLEDYETVIAKPESQNKKIKEEQYKTTATRKSIGFGK